MANGALYDLTIRGIVAALPDNKQETVSKSVDFGESAVNKLIETTGVKTTYRVLPKQTASDLCYDAAEKMLASLGWEKDSVDILVFVSHAPDYDRPATACVLQGRLELSTDCLAFDVSLGCSGFVYGLSTIGSYMQQEHIKRGLLLTGDMSSLAVNPETTNNLLFGDCGCAVALEQKEGAEAIDFLLKTDGRRYQDLLAPGGGYRHRTRKDKYVYMNGNNVFSFSITDVVRTIKDFMEQLQISPKDLDLFVLHQANAMIMKSIAKKCKISPEKVPLAIYQYGNTASSSIPLAIVDALEKQPLEKERIHVLASGFGLGLSWGVIRFFLDKDIYIGKIMTKNFFDDGFYEE